MYQVIEKKFLAPTIGQFIVEAPLIARKRKAGSFVILRATETGERIPITIVDSDTERGTITLIIQSIGKTTRLINERMNKGDSFVDVAGPLGHPTPVEYVGRVVCIGGGVGAAEVYPIARALKEHGNKVIGIIGGRNKELIILEEEMRQVADRLIITTDDGSYGNKGFVTDALKDLIKEDGDIKRVFAIGPIRMMKAVADTTRPAKIKTYVSLNPLMMDGTGMCGACRVTVGGDMKFACVDGPEFDAHLVNYDELIARNKSYADMENCALEMYEQSLKR